MSGGVSIEAVVRGGDRLGETPLWCDRTQRLWWVDIENPKLQGAADKAFAWSDAEYVKQEAELIAFFKQAGLKVYAPDVAAFRDFSNKKYLDSSLSKEWPAEMLDKINAL